MKVSDDFVKFCLDNYHTPIFSREEFESDLNRIVILKKMFRRYATTGQINERLILNNIIILLNVFGLEATNIILFYRLGDDFYSYIKTFLLFLNSYVSNDITDLIEIDAPLMNLLHERI